MREKTKRLIALALSALMLLGSGVTVMAADTTETAGDGSQSSIALQGIAESLNLISYEAYKSKYGYVDEKDKT